MLKNLFLKSVFVLFATLSFAVAKDPAPAKEGFRVPRSTLDAIERKLKSEGDPHKRIQLLLRWVKNKEEYEQSVLEKKQDVAKKTVERGKSIEPEKATVEDVGAFKTYKLDIIDRIEKEIADLTAKPGLKLDPLYHVLGFRLLEIQRYNDAVVAFQKIIGKTAEDYMGLGDAYFSASDTKSALEAFEHGGLDLKYRNTAAYKRAWCFLQMSEFEKALAEFDIALEDNPFNSIKLKEEAYRDRLRPYVETYKKDSFDDEELAKLKLLASKVYPQQPAKAKELVSTGLKNLIQAFNAKAQVDIAQNVFAFLTKEIPDATAVLLMAAPLWIKVYRGQLNHDAVQKIVRSLPSKKFEGMDTSALQTELYNSVVFYDTLYKEDSSDDTRKILFEINQKFFVLFPDDPNADPLRITYAKLLLENDDPAECIQILARRKGGEKEIEDLALSLDAKCELKQLDQLYKQEHNEFFYAKLKQNLLEKKIYERTDLGLSSENAFESLSRMLIGAVNKNTKMPYLREMLAELMAKYPFGKETKLYTDIQTLLAELTFQDILESKDAPDDRADRFFKVYQIAPKGSDVSKKSLLNSIVIGRESRILDRCEIFYKSYSDEFRPGKEVFDRCIRLAEHHLNLEKEYSFWMQNEDRLNDTQALKVGLIELALDKGKGRKRIQRIKSDSAKSAMELWDGIGTSKGKEKPNSRLETLLDNGKSFFGSLKPIPFAKIKSVVPGRIKDFETLDLAAVNFYKSKPTPIAMAHTLEFRAELATKMRNWIHSLPEPAGLTPDELTQYRGKTQEVVKVWDEGAAKRTQECGEVAHTLSIEYKVSHKDACPEITPSATFDRYLEKWEVTRQTAPQVAPWNKDEVVEKGESVGFLLDGGASSKDPARAKYFYIRALDLATTDYERARAYLALAKLMNKDFFWEAAGALDGNLLEPLQWWRKRASGNPFFEKLYDRMLSQIK